MKNLKKKIANDLIAYTIATYAVQVLGIVTSIAIRYFLGPAQMGVWSLLDLTLNYGLYANLGVLTALYTEMPYYFGRNDLQKVEDIRNVSFAFTVLSALLAAALFIAWAVFAGGKFSLEFRFGVALMAFILISTSLYNFYMALMWAEKKFLLLSKGIVINALLYFFFIILLVSTLNLKGLLIAVFASTTLAFFYLHRKRKAGLKIQLKKEVLLTLLKTGLPLMIVGFVYTTFMSIDRMMIARYLGMVSLGHYSIALLVISFSNSIPKLISVVIFPNMQENFGQTGSMKEISPFITRPTILLAYCTPILLGFAYFTVPFLVHFLLPKYEPGLDSMRIFLIGSFFLSLAQPIQTYLTTVYKRLHNIPLIAVGMAAAFSFCYLFIKKGLGLEGVALGMSLGFLFYYVVLFFYVFKHFSSLRESLLYFGETIFCFLYFAGVVLGTEKWVHFSSELLTFTFKCFVFGTASLPLLWFANKKTAAFTVLWETIRSHFALKLIPAKESYEAQP